MLLTGGALARLQALTPDGLEARIDLTITDGGPRVTLLLGMASCIVPTGDGRPRPRAGESGESSEADYDRVGLCRARSRAMAPHSTRKRG